MNARNELFKLQCKYYKKKWLRYVCESVENIYCPYLVCSIDLMLKGFSKKTKYFMKNSL